MEQGAPDKQIGYILRSYPRLSQTFILNEILALQRLGLDLEIFAVTNPREEVVQSQAKEVRAPVNYLDSVNKRGRLNNVSLHKYWIIHAPKRYSSALLYTLLHTDIDAGYRASSRFECFQQAVYLAWLIQDEALRTGRKIGHIHAHFAHDPAFIASLVHMLTGIPFSFTAHARDIYQLPVSILSQRVEQASTVITCCLANIHYFERVLPSALQSKVQLIHHGLDLHDFQRPTTNNTPGIPLILSVGRLVEKKGFFDLLQACTLLRQSGAKFKVEIYGDGPLRADLDRFIQQNGLAEQVTVACSRTQKQLIPIYQHASIFALTPSVAEDGDRDGIPNVLIEAMACNLPVVTTRVGGIPELVRHNENGLLFMPHDTQSVANGLADLLSDDLKRHQLGSSGRRMVANEFDISTTSIQLAAIFKHALGVNPSQRVN